VSGRKEEDRGCSGATKEEEEKESLFSRSHSSRKMPCRDMPTGCASLKVHRTAGFCTRTCLRSSSPASYLFKTLSAHFRKISSTDTPLRADDSRKMSSLLCAKLLPSRNVTSRLSCKSLLFPATCGIQVEVSGPGCLGLALTVQSFLFPQNLCSPQR
jgi:hypothetical protein